MASSKSQKIAFVKVGWSENYEGRGAVIGQHAWLEAEQDGAEKFNFKRVDGRFLGYVPPIGRTYAVPNPKDRSNWLVVFVARYLGEGPLTVVGWYENAKFEAERQRRPENQKDTQGNFYEYCVSAPVAFSIPISQRFQTIDGGNFKRASIVYARSNGPKDTDLWRKKLVKIATELTERRSVAGLDVSDAIFDIEGDGIPDRAASVVHHFIRDQKVRAKVLLRAGGKCEFCGKNGFLTLTGSRYLECHHVIALAKDGKDLMTNIIALCPDHHREAHYGKNAEVLEEKMIAKVAALQHRLKSRKK